MSPSARLTSDQRRLEILDAVQRQFAEQGFHGTTTKHLAEAAGVSVTTVSRVLGGRGTTYCPRCQR